MADGHSVTSNINVVSTLLHWTDGISRHDGTKIFKKYEVVTRSVSRSKVQKQTVFDIKLNLPYASKFTSSIQTSELEVFTEGFQIVYQVHVEMGSILVSFDGTLATGLLSLSNKPAWWSWIYSLLPKKVDWNTLKGTTFTCPENTELCNDSNEHYILPKYFSLLTRKSLSEATSHHSDLSNEYPQHEELPNFFDEETTIESPDRGLASIEEVSEGSTALQYNHDQSDIVDYADEKEEAVLKTDTSEIATMYESKGGRDIVETSSVILPDPMSLLKWIFKQLDLDLLNLLSREVKVKMIQMNLFCMRTQFIPASAAPAFKCMPDKAKAALDILENVKQGKPLVQAALQWGSIATKNGWIDNDVDFIPPGVPSSLAYKSAHEFYEAASIHLLHFSQTKSLE